MKPIVCALLLLVSTVVRSRLSSGQKTNPYRDINILATFVDATMMSIFGCAWRIIAQAATKDAGL